MLWTSALGESPVFNFTLYILRFLLRQDNLTRLQVHEVVAVVVKESSEESMIQSVQYATVIFKIL